MFRIPHRHLWWALGSLKSSAVSLWHWPALCTLEEDCLDYGIVESEFDLQSQFLITPDVVHFLEGWWCFCNTGYDFLVTTSSFAQNTAQVAKLFHKFEWVIVRLYLYSSSALPIPHTLFCLHLWVYWVTSPASLATLSTESVSCLCCVTDSSIRAVSSANTRSVGLSSFSHPSPVPTLLLQLLHDAWPSPSQLGMSGDSK